MTVTVIAAMPRWRQALNRHVTWKIACPGPAVGRQPGSLAALAPAARVNWHLKRPVTGTAALRLAGTVTDTRTVSRRPGPGGAKPPCPGHRAAVEERQRRRAAAQAAACHGQVDKLIHRQALKESGLGPFFRPAVTVTVPGLIPLSGSSGWRASGGPARLAGRTGPPGPGVTVAARRPASRSSESVRAIYTSDRKFLVRDDSRG